ncbi:MAG: hypothetical protein ACP5XB_02500 [Isosphaeraceae bacterium]
MPTRPPDALMLPEAWKRGETQYDRIDSILAIAEPLLNVDRSKGERAYIRRQPGGRLFVTADPQDTMQFPIGHSQEGRSRYNWVASPDGAEYGYLIEDARHA